MLVLYRSGQNGGPTPLFGCSLFSVEWGMGEIRRPRPEIRKKLEIRNPKSEPVGLREAGSRECHEPELRLESLNWPPSGFGLRISFGFRASDFELWISSFGFRALDFELWISSLFHSK
jgi:hypothetical protein